MRKVRVKFTDFWDHNNGRGRFVELFGEHFNIEESDDPEVLFFSAFGKEHKKYDCKKVFISWENYKHLRKIDFKDYDYAMSHYYVNDPRYYWMPSWGWHMMFNKERRKFLLHKPTDDELDAMIAKKSKFCVFVVSSGGFKRRNNFFKDLSKYKKVDSAGGFMNNIGMKAPRPADEYQEFLSQYKFIISFENTSTVGYTTEKIFNAYYSHVVPIYWGNPQIHRECNVNSFVNVHDFKKDKDAFAYIRYLDEHPDQYRKVLGANKLAGNEIPMEFSLERFLKWVEQIFYGTSR